MTREHIDPRYRRMIDDAEALAEILVSVEYLCHRAGFQLVAGIHGLPRVPFDEIWDCYSVTESESEGVVMAPDSSGPRWMKGVGDNITMYTREPPLPTGKGFDHGREPLLDPPTWESEIEEEPSKETTGDPGGDVND